MGLLNGRVEAENAYCTHFTCCCDCWAATSERVWLLAVSLAALLIFGHAGKHQGRPKAALAEASPGRGAAMAEGSLLDRDTLFRR